MVTAKLPWFAEVTGDVKKVIMKTIDEYYIQPETRRSPRNIVGGAADADGLPVDSDATTAATVVTTRSTTRAATTAARAGTSATGAAVDVTSDDDNTAVAARKSMCTRPICQWGMPGLMTTAGAATEAWGALVRSRPPVEVPAVLYDQPEESPYHGHSLQ